MSLFKKACKGTFNILKSTNLKAMLLKLGIALCLLFITYFVPSFKWVLLALFAVYVTLEYSASSLIWVIFGAVTLPYTILFGKVGLYYIIMGELLAIYLIKLVFMLIKKQIHIKNWRTITLISLLGAFTLLLLLPLSQTYSFGSQMSFLFLVLFLMGTLIFIKEINVKDFLFSLVIMILALCVVFLFAGLFIKDLGTVFGAHYSKGQVFRFMPFQSDPNFSVGILFITLMALFILYKQAHINKIIYFTLLTILGFFYLRTLSKAGILVLALFAAYVVIDVIVSAIKAKDSKKLLELVWYLVAASIVCILEWQFIDAFFIRFEGKQEGWWNQDAGANIVDNFTTGRSTLWIGYIKTILTTPQILLFGAGIKAPYILKGAPHSAPIEYVYRIGLIEVLLLLAIFVISAIPYLKNLKAYNFIPIILITVFYCSIGSTSSKHMLIFIVSFMALCCAGLECQVKERENIIFTTVKKKKK